MFLVFTFVGLFGAFFGIYASFAALEVAENAGIGAVGDGISNAFISTAVGLVGSIAGVVIFVIGTIRRKRYR